MTGFCQCTDLTRYRVTDEVGLGHTHPRSPGMIRVALIALLTEESA